VEAPACGKCKRARLKVAYAHLTGHRGQGNWTCRGVFDKDMGVHMPCFYTAGPGRGVAENKHLTDVVSTNRVRVPQ
jgi:hypothetical protein